MITHREVIKAGEQLGKDAVQHWMYEVGSWAGNDEIMDYYGIPDLDEYAANWLLQYGIHWDYTDWNTDFTDAVERQINNFFTPYENSERQ